jgi:hypothetical protein
MADRKIRISARLWMNGLDPARRRHEAGRRHRERTVLVGFSREKAFIDPPRRTLARPPMRSAGDVAQIDKQNHNSILKPCQITVVYQASDRSRIIAS